MVSSTTQRTEQELYDARFAMRLSLVFGLVMLIGKIAAFLMTHSAAILSDAAESVIHVIAVAFASFSLRLSTKPASSQFHYGYERITFFSAGFEGAMIVVAAIVILFESIRRWIAGLQLEHPAIAVAVNILWSGGHLVWRSAVGLLDYSDPKAGREIRNKLDAICSGLAIQYPACASALLDIATSSRSTCCSRALHRSVCHTALQQFWRNVYPGPKRSNKDGV